MAYLLLYAMKIYTFTEINRYISVVLQLSPLPYYNCISVYKWIFFLSLDNTHVIVLQL